MKCCSFVRGLHEVSKEYLGLLRELAQSHILLAIQRKVSKYFLNTTVIHHIQQGHLSIVIKDACNQNWYLAKNIEKEILLMQFISYVYSLMI